MLSSSASGWIKASLCSPAVWCRQKRKYQILIGANYADAQQRLDRACEPQPCLRSQVRWETNDEQASSLVLRSEPPTGTELLWGSAVTVTLSQGEPINIEQPIANGVHPGSGRRIPDGQRYLGGFCCRL